MRTFNYVGELNGGNKPMIIKFKLTENVPVRKGQIVFYNTGNGTVSTKNISERVLGICATEYSNEESDLDPNMGKGMIDVIVSPYALYKTQPVIVESAREAELSVSFDNPGFALGLESLNGSKLILAEKGENSENEHEIGTVYNICGVYEDSGNNFAVEPKVHSYPGDKFIFIPAFGCNCFSAVGTDGDIDIELTRVGDISVMFCDEDTHEYTVRIMNQKWFDGHYFGEG